MCQTATGSAMVDTVRLDRFERGSGGMASWLKILSALRHMCFKNPNRILNPPFPSIGYLQKITIVTLTLKYPQFSPRFPKIPLHYNPPCETPFTPIEKSHKITPFQKITQIHQENICSLLHIHPYQKKRGSIDRS